MAQLVVGTATTACSLGLAPSVLLVIPEKRITAGGLPLANVLDFKPLVNVVPFGLCASLANPVVATATAAALGALTPMPCTPVTTPWKPGSLTVLAGGAPALTSTSTCQCAYGGVITVVSPGQLTVQAP